MPKNVLATWAQQLGAFRRFGAWDPTPTRVQPADGQHIGFVAHSMATYYDLFRFFIRLPRSDVEGPWSVPFVQKDLNAQLPRALPPQLLAS